MSKKKKDTFLKKLKRKRERQNTTIASKSIRNDALFWATFSLPFVIFDPTGISAILTLSGYTMIGGTFGEMKALGKDINKINNGELSHYSFTGSDKDIIEIASMQFLIEELSEKYKNSAELPEGIKEKIALHIQDIQPILEQVKIFENGKEIQNINFIRSYEIPKTSQKILQLISSAPINGSFFNTTDIWPLPKLTAEDLRRIKKRKEDKKIAAKFNTMSKKIEDLERKLAQKQTPKYRVINKPRYKNN